MPPWKWFRRDKLPPIARDRRYWMEAANAAANAESRAERTLIKRQTKQ